MIPHVVVIRHPKEKVSKCSLQPFFGQPGFTFYTAKHDFTYSGDGHVLLAIGAPEIDPADAFTTKGEASRIDPALVVTQPDGRSLRPLLVLDSTWRLLPSLRRRITGSPVERALPVGVRTAYPRISKMTEDPDIGLASIEALYLALRGLGFDRTELLDSYRWREEFLRQFE